MSMKDNPGSGWEIELEDLKKALPKDKQAQLDQLIEECSAGDGDRIEKFLRPLMKRLGFPEAVTVWFFDDEGQSDDLESSQFYVSFAETDLFKITPKTAFKKMEDKGVAPRHSRWTEWG
jgi:hypothetical protein